MVDGVGEFDDFEVLFSQLFLYFFERGDVFESNVIDPFSMPYHMTVADDDIYL